jgi:hypothetical protein
MPDPKSDPKSAAEPPVWAPAASSGPVTESAASSADAAVAAGAPGAAGAAGAVKPRRSGAVTGLLAIIALVASAGVAFAAGRASAPGTATTGTTGAGGNVPGLVRPDGSFLPDQFGQPGDRDGLGFGGSAAVSGKVTAVAAGTITLELANGQTVTLATSSTTTYHTQSSATSADVATGDTVKVTVAGNGNGPNADAGLGGRSATDVTVASK